MGMSRLGNLRIRRHPIVGVVTLIADADCQPVVHIRRPQVQGVRPRMAVGDDTPPHRSVVTDVADHVPVTVALRVLPGNVARIGRIVLIGIGGGIVIACLEGPHILRRESPLRVVQVVEDEPVHVGEEGGVEHMLGIDSHLCHQLQVRVKTDDGRVIHPLGLAVAGDMAAGHPTVHPAQGPGPMLRDPSFGSERLTIPVVGAPVQTGRNRQRLHRRRQRDPVVIQVHGAANGLSAIQHRGRAFVKRHGTQVVRIQADVEIGTKPRQVVQRKPLVQHLDTVAAQAADDGGTRVRSEVAVLHTRHPAQGLAQRSRPAPLQLLASDFIPAGRHGSLSLHDHLVQHHGLQPPTQGVRRHTEVVSSPSDERKHDCQPHRHAPSRSLPEQSIESPHHEASTILMLTDFNSCQPARSVTRIMK
ncbi:unknown [Bacteroides sp. CAG:462]|nr:unknown [Bacteroides sp. CAG:462]